MQAAIENYVIIDDAGQSSYVGNSSAAEEVCTSSFNVLRVDLDEGSAIFKSNKSPANDVHDDIEKIPCTFGDLSLVPSMTTTCEAHTTTMTEMFPQLSEAKVHAALRQANFDIELAVTYCPSSLASSTPQQVYTAFDFCNKVDKMLYKREMLPK